MINQFNETLENHTFTGKPKVGIFGAYKTYRYHSQLDLIHFGYAHTWIKHLDEETKAMLCRELDLIIFHDLGGGCHYWNQYLHGLKQGKAKTVYWSFDSHHEHGGEKLVAELFHGMATAHSWTIPLIGPNAFWVPCCLVWNEPGEYIDVHNEPRARWFDWGCIGRKYAPRAELMDAWRSWFESLHQKVFLAETDVKSLPFLYSQCRYVFNVAHGNDLNMRVFEGLAAGCPMLMTDVQDIQHARFADLLPFIATLPREHTFEQFEKVVLKHMHWCCVSHNQAQIIFDKHTLTHRYQEIAEHVL